jgi:hypothetical protein
VKDSDAILGAALDQMLNILCPAKNNTQEVVREIHWDSKKAAFA